MAVRQQEDRTKMLERVDYLLHRADYQTETATELVGRFNESQKRKEEGKYFAAGGASLQILSEKVIRELQRTSQSPQISFLKIIPQDLPALPVSSPDCEEILLSLFQTAMQSIGSRPGMITIEARLGGGDQPGKLFFIRFSYTFIECLEDGDIIPETDCSVAGPPSAYLELHAACRLLEGYGGTLKIETSSRTTSCLIELPSIPDSTSHSAA